VKTLRGSRFLHWLCFFYALTVLSVYGDNDSTFVHEIFVLTSVGSLALAIFHLLLFRNSPDRPRPAILVASIVSLVLGVACFWEEYRHKVCYFPRSSLVQPHAIWHFFTAWALVFAYAFGRSMGCGSWQLARQALFLGEEAKKEQEEEVDDMAIGN